MVNYIIYIQIYNTYLIYSITISSIFICAIHNNLYYTYIYLSRLEVNSIVTYESNSYIEEYVDSTMLDIDEDIIPNSHFTYTDHTNTAQTEMEAMNSTVHVTNPSAVIVPLSATTEASSSSSSSNSNDRKKSKYSTRKTLASSNTKVKIGFLSR